MTHALRPWLALAPLTLLLACGSGDPPAGPKSGQGSDTGAKSETAKAKSAVDEGVILGLRDGTGALRTAFATRAGIRWLGEGVAVPRAKGWWKLDVGKSTANQGTYVSTYVMAGPADVALKAPAPSDMTGCTQNSSLTVLFVGPDHVSFHQQEDGFCEGTAHPYVSEALVMRPLDGLAEQQSLSISDVGGSEALSAFQAAGASAKTKHSQPDCLDEVQPTYWGLIRSQGQWTYRGLLYWSNEACRGMSQLFSVQGQVPEKLTGPDAQPVAWKDELKANPGLLDRVVSPKGGLRVEVRADGLRVIAEGGEEQSLKVRGASVVLAQWALGEKNVARWQKEAEAALAKRP